MWLLFVYWTFNLTNKLAIIQISACLEIIFFLGILFFELLTMLSLIFTNWLSFKKKLIFMFIFSPIYLIFINIFCDNFFSVFWTKIFFGLKLLTRLNTLLSCIKFRTELSSSNWMKGYQFHLLGCIKLSTELSSSNLMKTYQFKKLLYITFSILWFVWGICYKRHLRCIMNQFGVWNEVLCVKILR